MSKNYELWLQNSEYLGLSLNIEGKKKRYSGTEESFIFADADSSVVQGTEKISLFLLRLQRDSSSYLALLLFCKHFSPVTVRPQIVNVLLLPSSETDS